MYIQQTLNTCQYINTSVHDVMGTPYKPSQFTGRWCSAPCVTQPCLNKWKYDIIHSECSVFGVVRTTACSARCERVFIYKLISDWFILAHFLQGIDRLTPCLWDGGLVLWCSRLIIMSILWALEYVDISLQHGVFQSQTQSEIVEAHLCFKSSNVWAITSL